MNKQEAIEKIEKLKGLTIKEKNLILDIEMISKGDVLEIIEQIDEPEKTVVPQFVADMIVKRKRAGQSVIKAIENLRFYEDACKWVRNNGETFVKAWIFGYEVEKEKLYTVEFPNPNSDNHLVLRKNFDGKVCISLLHSEYWRGNESTQLTEAEIREGFAWAWKYAKEVKE
ncbi:hypothetical protein Si086_01244 [Streptococcus infantarius subsp. infantarius]|nr:hypothetical protein [Streptococcus infantarius subsp. infantarius]